MSDAGLGARVDDLFRRHAARMLAGLVHTLGPARLELCEDAVQDALLQALKRWRFHGVPDEPEAWLSRVARNAALDKYRLWRKRQGV